MRAEEKEGAFAEVDGCLTGLSSSASACFFFHFLFFPHRQGAQLTPSLFSCDTPAYHGLFPAQKTLVAQNIFREEGSCFHAYFM